MFTNTLFWTAQTCKASSISWTESRNRKTKRICYFFRQIKKKQLINSRISNASRYRRQKLADRVSSGKQWWNANTPCTTPTVKTQLYREWSPLSKSVTTDNTTVQDHVIHWEDWCKGWTNERAQVLNKWILWNYVMLNITVCVHVQWYARARACVCACVCVRVC